MREPLLDSHVHLSSKPIVDQVDKHLERARQAGVSGWVVPGVRPGDWACMKTIADRFAAVFLAPGVHPMEEAQWNSAVRERLAALLQHSQVVAVGEIGLDKRLDVSVKRQEEVFLEQIELASQRALPVIIHCCQRYGRLLELLDRVGFSHGGVFHGFSGSLEVAQEGWKRGFALGIGGLVTRPESRRLRGVVQALPPEALVLETDAPDGAPHPHRGKVNRPEWLPLIAQQVADLRGWTLEETAQITRANTVRQLCLPKGLF